jgi:hypothetical protein
MAQDYTIEVKVEQGVLVYELTNGGGSPNDGKKAHVRFNDKVRWIYRKGTLACLFKLSPFKETVTSAEPGVYTGKLTVDKKHVAGGNNTYSYSVAVVVQPDGIPLHEDPEIIVDEDPTPIGRPTRKR